MPGEKRRTPRLPVTYCSARKTDGSRRCRRFAIKGGAVCASHGGRTPAIKAAAQRRLLASVDRLMGHLLRIADDEAMPPAVRLAAIRDGLDRAGLAAKTGIEIDVGPTWQELVGGVVAEVPDGWSPVYTFEPDPDYQPAGEIVDAELVEEERAAPALPAPIPSSGRVPARIAERLGKGRR